MGLNGNQSLVQMQWLVEQVELLSGKQKRHRFTDIVTLKSCLQGYTPRRDSISSGKVPPEEWQVPRAGAFLSELQSRGLKLVLASGSDRDAVELESGLLQVREFFGDELHAPFQATRLHETRGD